MHDVQDIDAFEDVRIDKAAQNDDILVTYSQSAHPPV